jgi:hypothetical protein
MSSSSEITMSSSSESIISSSAVHTPATEQDQGMSSGSKDSQKTSCEDGRHGLLIGQASKDAQATKKRKRTEDDEDNVPKLDRRPNKRTSPEQRRATTGEFAVLPKHMQKEVLEARKKAARRTRKTCLKPRPGDARNFPSYRWPTGDKRKREEEPEQPDKRRKIETAVAAENTTTAVTAGPYPQGMPGSFPEDEPPHAPDRDALSKAAEKRKRRIAKGAIGPFAPRRSRRPVRQDQAAGPFQPPKGSKLNTLKQEKPKPKSSKPKGDHLPQKAGSSLPSPPEPEPTSSEDIDYVYPDRPLCPPDDDPKYFMSGGLCGGLSLLGQESSDNVD